MKFTRDWFDHNIPVWKKVLRPLIGKPVRIAEIGSFEGRSSVWLLDNILTHKDAVLVCVDTWNGSAEHDDIDMKKVEERFDSNISTYGDKVIKYKGRSDRFLTAFYKDEDIKFDVIYIDGSHLARDVLCDAVLADKLLKPGGILIFDDYIWNGGLAHSTETPRAAIDAFMECYATQYQLLSSGNQVMLRKNGQDKDTTI